jgi:hypothetical protein
MRNSWVSRMRRQRARDEAAAARRSLAQEARIEDEHERALRHLALTADPHEGAEDGLSPER